MRGVNATALALLLVCAACSQVDTCAPDVGPLADLRCTESTARYGAGFWTAEAESDSEVWREARAFCAQSGALARDRCKLIGQVELVLNRRQEAADARRRLEALGGPVSPSPPAETTANDGFTGIPPGLPDPAGTSTEGPNDDGN